MKQKKTGKAKEPREEPKSVESEKLCGLIGDLQKEKDDLLGKLQRVSADYANYQKRAPKQIADTIAYEREKIIRTLLPVLDNFEHTLQNADSTENSDVLMKGIQIIYDQMVEILKSQGVEQIKSLGEKFDPSLHQAVMRRSETEQKEDIVLEEFQKGYKLNGRVIRPSKVIVNKPATEPAAEQAQPEEKKPEKKREQ
jgi:molecular chaperone GrpE